MCSSTKPRLDLFEDGIRSALQECERDRDRDPFLLCLWGGASSAKSVLIEVLNHRGCFPTRPLIIGMELYLDLLSQNAPEFREDPTAYQHFHNAVPHPEKTSGYRAEFYAFLYRAVDLAVSQGLSVIVDDNGDNAEAYQAFITRARQSPEPYEDILIGQATDPYYLAWRFQDHPPRRKHYDPQQTPAAFDEIKSLMETWSEIAPYFRTAILNETTLHMEYKVEQMEIVSESQTLFQDSDRLERVFSRWKGFKFDPKHHYAKTDFSSLITQATGTPTDLKAVRSPTKRITMALKLVDTSPKLGADGIAR